jgi:hypothetical protein
MTTRAHGCSRSPIGGSPGTSLAGNATLGGIGYDEHIGRELNAVHRDGIWATVESACTKRSVPLADADVPIRRSDRRNQHPWGQTMTIPKSKVLAVLRARGQHDRADWVDRTLPDRIDTARNAGLLSMLSINADDLADEDSYAPAVGPS